jgi:hypothetical protein
VPLFGPPRVFEGPGVGAGLGLGIRTKQKRFAKKSILAWCL